MMCVIIALLGFHSQILLYTHSKFPPAKVRVLCTFKALDTAQNDEISLKEFYKFYDVLSLRWERVSGANGAIHCICYAISYTPVMCILKQMQIATISVVVCM